MIEFVKICSASKYECLVLSIELVLDLFGEYR